MSTQAVCVSTVCGETLSSFTLRLPKKLPCFRVDSVTVEGASTPVSCEQGQVRRAFSLTVREGLTSCNVSKMDAFSLLGEVVAAQRVSRSERTAAPVLASLPPTHWEEQAGSAPNRPVWVRRPLVRAC